MNANKFLRVLLGLICLFHIGIGAGLNLSSRMAPLMADLYGADLTWTPEFTYILKPLGAFMLALGLIGIAAVRDPLRYRVIIYGFVVLFLIRCAQRWLFAGEISDHFGIEGGRNVGNSVFFLALALTLIILLRVAGKQSVAGSAAT